MAYIFLKQWEAQASIKGAFVGTTLEWGSVSGGGYRWFWFC